jgi:hypothetical protein
MSIKKITNYLISKIKRKTIFKQELLLMKALKEKGLYPKDLTIRCDHDLGLNYVNDVKLGIKYPDSFFHKAVSLTTKNRNADFYFNGYINESGGRGELLEPFKKFTNSIIISSDEGRNQAKKDIFNENYFSQLSNAKFGLCPHQIDWPGSKKHMWTYRFIESCFVGAIPVLFMSTPLGDNFINGYYYVWDKDFTEDYTCAINKYSHRKATVNQVLARKQFCLTDVEVAMIVSTL